MKDARFARASHLLAVLPLLCVLAGCGSPTKLSTSWKNPSATGPLAFKKVAVVVLNSTPGDRRAQEDELVRHITRTKAVSSHSFVQDNELGDHAKVKQRIIDDGFDGAVVLRLVDTQKETTYVPGNTSYWYDGASFVPYQYSSGYYVTDTIVRAEVSLYTVPEGKLIWAGSSATTNPANARELAMQVAQAAAAELRKQGLLQ